MSTAYTLHLGDCLDIMPGIPDGSVDFIFTDPPYPYIKRDYGYWTEETWMPMMQEAVRQGRRILKPHGSMVMVLQPNSEKVGKMRLWLWRFMVWCGEYWNIVQDAYWWNPVAQPTVHTQRQNGLMRSSIKYCLWLGENCYKNQEAVLWSQGRLARASEKAASRFSRQYTPSGHSMNVGKLHQIVDERGGVTPYNVLPISNGYTTDSDTPGAYGHGAGTPLELTDWWLRYLTKSGDTVLDPFSGSGTTGVAAKNLGRGYIGIEKDPGYFGIAKDRLERAERELSKQPYLMAEVAL